MSMAGATLARVVRKMRRPERRAAIAARDKAELELDTEVEPELE